MLVFDRQEKENVAISNNQCFIKKLEVTAATSNPIFSRLINVMIIFNFIQYKLIGCLQITPLRQPQTRNKIARINITSENPK